MLNIVSEIIAAVSMILSSIYISKKMFLKDVNIINFKNIFLMIIFVIITVLLYNAKYSPLAPISIYLCMIVIYKFIFNLELSKSILLMGLVFAFYFVADALVTLFLLNFFTTEQIRENPIIFLLSNLTVTAIVISLVSINPLRNKLGLFVQKIEKHKYYDTIVFIALVILVFSFIVYNIINAATLSKSYFIDVAIMCIFFALAFIFINDKLKKDKLNDEYNKLMEYVENFEAWIEDEQLNKHEYKNQLAVIRAMASNNKKQINYIDNILKEDLYVEDFWANEIKYLPSGGIKGLLYYKLILTKKENIDVCLSVGRDSSDLIKNVNNEELKIISTVLGIYLDNAIEASKESLTKALSIEIYPINSKLIIVISNTFRGNIDIKKMNKKGYTTKGKGHGKGLYLANKIIKKTPILKSENSLINNFYVQKLIIQK